MFLHFGLVAAYICAPRALEHRKDTTKKETKMSHVKLVFSMNEVSHTIGWGGTMRLYLVVYGSGFIGQ